MGAAAAEAVHAVVEDLADALYELAHANAVRVLRFSGTPGDLACWALELLEEQACAVRLARALPPSTPGSLLLTRGAACLSLCSVWSTAPAMSACTRWA